MPGHGSRNIIAELLHPFGLESLLVAEVHILFRGYGDEVYMGMRDLESNHGHTYTLARHGLAQTFGNAFRKQFQREIFVIGKVEQIGHLVFGHNQNMAWSHRVYVEKSEVLLVFGDLVAWNLAGDDT